MSLHTIMRVLIDFNTIKREALMESCSEITTSHKQTPHGQHKMAESQIKQVTSEKCEHLARQRD